MSYRITSSGQVSIPAGVRRRWQTSRVDVEDHGDYVVVRPVPEDPVAAVRGIFKDRMKMTTDELRRQVREEERLAMERKEAQYRR
jgi:bifunctional DNA-binding transcriptional regulator/antitoxin component of YhaV-PrlF toxin-antitoxin module